MGDRGTALGPDQLVDFPDKVPPQVLVVIDEAYTEFTDDTVPNGMDMPRRVVYRTQGRSATCT